MTRTEYNNCVDLFSDDIFRFLLKSCRSKELAEDIVQESYLILWEHVREIAFEKLWFHAQTKPFAIKTTEAPHYRRYVLRKGGNPLDVPRPFRFAPGDMKDPSTFSRARHRAPLGVTDGRGIMFVSSIGKIYPAGFLPLFCGHFPDDSVVDVYRNHPVFKALQNPDHYKGICGRCEFRYVCGGSRARAFAVTGDFLEAEPDCSYQVGQAPLYVGQ